MADAVRRIPTLERDGLQIWDQSDRRPAENDLVKEWRAI
jgi:hypothetical protein